MRLRLRYTKLGRVRFTSARDLSSVWERALRRADLPIAYSQGFTPHPKVSFPDALPVGHASTGEYAELTMAREVDPGRALARLSAALPTGMDVLTYYVVPDGAKRLAKYLQATLWEIAWPAAPAAHAAALAAELRHRGDALLARDSHEVVRHRPKGDKVLDVRPPLVACTTALVPATGPSADPAAAGTAIPTSSDPTVATFRAVLRNVAPTIRPVDLVSALDALGDDPLPEPRLFTRVAQGELVDDGLREALTRQVEPLDAGRHVEAA